MPVDAKMSRFGGAGSVKLRRSGSAPCVCVVLERLPIVGITGSELTRWLDPRVSFMPGCLASRCFLALDPEVGRRSAIEKERLRREASSGAMVDETAVEGRTCVFSMRCGAPGLGAATAAV